MLNSALLQVFKGSDRGLGLDLHLRLFGHWLVIVKKQLGRGYCVVQGQGGHQDDRENFRWVGQPNSSGPADKLFSAALS